MSLLKSLGKIAGKIVHVGAPIAGFALGGPLGAGIGGALGGFGDDLLSGHNSLKGIPKALGQGAAIGAGAYGLQKLGGGGLLGGLKKVGGGLLNAGGGAGGIAGSLLKGAGGAAGGLLSGIGGIGGIADAGLGAASIAGGIGASNRAEELRKKALGISEGSWNDRANLRKLGIAGLEQNAPQDLSGIFSNPSNPFMKRVA